MSKYKYHNIGSAVEEAHAIETLIGIEVSDDYSLAFLTALNNGASMLQASKEAMANHRGD